MVLSNVFKTVPNQAVDQKRNSILREKLTWAAKSRKRICCDTVFQNLNVPDFTKPDNRTCLDKMHRVIENSDKLRSKIKIFFILLCFLFSNYLSFLSFDTCQSYFVQSNHRTVWGSNPRQIKTFGFGSQHSIHWAIVAWQIPQFERTYIERTNLFI